MKRRIFLWMGLSVLFVISGFSTAAMSAERYQAKQGSTLYTIAQKYGVSVADLKKANRLKSAALKPGQVLVIPDKQGKGKAVAGSSKKEKSVADAPKKGKAVAKARTRTSTKTSVYVVKRGDNIYTIAKRTGVSVAEIKRINHLRGNALKAGHRLALVRKSTIREVAIREASLTRKSGAFELDDDEDFVEDDSVAVEDNLLDVEKEKNLSSSVLGVWNTPGEQKLLVKVVKGFLGTPYRLGGQTVKGIDCSGFVAKIYKFFDVSLPRTAREQARVGKAVSKDELVEGDLVFFNTRRAFGHVGIYIGNNEFIHASSGRAEKAVRIDNLDKPYYNKRFIKAVRVKGFDDKSVHVKVKEDQV